MWQKIVGMNQYRKPNQEKSPAEVMVQISTNDSSSDKEQKDIAYKIIQPTKSVKVEANKLAVSSIPPRKKINNKTKEVKAHLKYICASVTHSNINPQRQINAKGLHSSGDELQA